MKFRIFSLSEKLYKIISAIATILVTIGCFLYYNSLDDKTNTFVVATAYAAFLFIVGLYLSYMSNSISNKLYERKNVYIMLKRLDEVFSSSCMKSLNSYGDINRAVIAFQVFSGRTKGHVNRNEKKNAVVHTVPLDFMIGPQPQIDYDDPIKKKHYIEEIGFCFEPKLMKVEEAYNLKYSNLRASIQEEINTYITDNNIELSIRGKFSELDLLDTDYEDWCNRYVSEKSPETRESLMEYIYKTIDDHQVDFNNLEDKKMQLIKYYKKCNARIQANLKRMNNTYGNRLEFIIKSREDILAGLESLFDQIKMLENSIDTLFSETVDACSTNINNISSSLSELQENIANEIQVNNMMIEESLERKLNTFKEKNIEEQH